MNFVTPSIKQRSTGNRQVTNERTAHQERLKIELQYKISTTGLNKQMCKTAPYLILLNLHSMSSIQTVGTRRHLSSREWLVWESILPRCKARALSPELVFPAFQLCKIRVFYCWSTQFILSSWHIQIVLKFAVSFFGSFHFFSKAVEAPGSASFHCESAAAARDGPNGVCCTMRRSPGFQTLKFQLENHSIQRLLYPLKLWKWKGPKIWKKIRIGKKGGMVPSVVTYKTSPTAMYWV